MDNNEKIKTKHNSRNLNNKYTHIVIKNTYIYTYIHTYTYTHIYGSIECHLLIIIIIIHHHKQIIQN